MGSSTTGNGTGGIGDAVSEHPWGEVVAEFQLCQDPAAERTVFTCADLANHATSFPCTGGYHVGTGQWIRCVCRCHQDVQQAGVTSPEVDGR